MRARLARQHCHRQRVCPVPRQRVVRPRWGRESARQSHPVLTRSCPLLSRGLGMHPTIRWRPWRFVIPPAMGPSSRRMTSPTPRRRPSPHAGFRRRRKRTRYSRRQRPPRARAR
ncbi:hypothetical protein ACFPRL_25390 [Pseudoclavibacter helvolus]